MNLSLQVEDLDGEDRFEIARQEPGDAERLETARKETGTESRRSSDSDIPVGRLSPDFLV